MAITPLPTPPDRGDPSTFSSRADAFLGALPTFATEANALATAVNEDAADALASAQAAEAAQLAAEAVQVFVESVSNIDVFNGATTYEFGDVVYSPTSMQSYRRRSSGQSFTDPAADPTNWTQLTALPDQTGNAGKFVTTDGTNASWSSVGTTLQKLGIFSAAAATASPVSSMNVVENGVYQTTIASNSYLNIAASSTLFCVVHNGNGSGSNASTSPDGMTWTTRALSTTSTSWTVASDGTGFLAVEGSSTVVNYSVTGVTFSATTSLPGNRQPGTNLVSRTTGEYITRGAASTTTLYHTVNNGTAWTTQTAPAANMNTLIVNSGMYVGNAGGSSYYTSATGLTGSWTTRTLPASCSVIGKMPDGTLVTYDSNKVNEQYISSDAINWTLVPSVPYNSVIIGATRISGAFHASGCTLVTLHNGVWVSRKSDLYSFTASALTSPSVVAKRGDLIAAVLSSSNANNVAIFDLSNSATAYFEA